MGTEFQTLTFSRSLPASLSATFFALTTTTGLRHWLCDACQADSQAGGRLYLWWESGYYASGVFTELDPAGRLGFTWFGREEPGPTEVRIRLERASQGVNLTLEHLGIGRGELWEETVGELKRGWEIALDNLVSVLETGRDLRRSRRPTLGIISGKLDPGQAGRLGLPDSPGVLVEGVLPGLGAEQAGLQAGDLIVSLGDRKIETPSDLRTALTVQLVGDRTPVVVFRSQTEIRLTVRLLGWPESVIPPTLEALARLIAEQYQELNGRLARMLANIEEPVVMLKPGGDRWSILEILAHLVASERENQTWIAALASDQVPVFSSNAAVWVQALVSTYPTLADLQNSLREAQELTLAMIKVLPEAFLQDRKAGYVDLCNGFQHARYHTNLHLQQVEALISAARPGG